VAGPLHDLPPPLPVAQDPWKRSVFCYLPGDYVYTPTVLESLAGLGLQVDAYLHPPPEDVHALRLPAAVQLRSRPAPLPYALGRSALVVHHGGVGTAEQVLALGRPQLVLPKTLEQGLNARALSALGVATLLESDARTPHAIVSAVSELLDGPHAAQRASEVARGLRRAGSLPVLLDLCDLLAGP
jgi:UDP:flavonoid glycosyltransferase YjiC (YdhE family)